MPDPSTRAPEVLEWRRDGYDISTDRARLDVDVIHRFLAREFWDTRGISREVLERALAHSVCFGVYEGERQIGFARVVTDRATFAFVCDDFIVESHRGRGLATWLMRCIRAHPALQRLRRIVLVTRDPRLYLKAGFTASNGPESYLEIADPHAYSAPATGSSSS